MTQVISKIKITKAKNLVKATYDALVKSIEILKDGVHLGDIGFTIQTTTDNSSYSNVTSNYDSISGDTNSNTYAHVTSTAVFDVTNTSTHKVRFQTEAVDTGISITDVAGRYLNVLFIRLGDT